jgi:hypothetical protein
MRTSEHALHDPYLSSTAIKSQQITTQQSSTSRGGGGMNGFVFIREANIRAAKQMLLSDSAMHTMDALSWECCGERK